jgi:hypothetical protein
LAGGKGRVVTLDVPDRMPHPCGAKREVGDEEEEQEEGEKMGADGVVCTGTGRARTRQLRNQKLPFEP